MRDPFPEPTPKAPQQATPPLSLADGPARDPSGIAAVNGLRATAMTPQACAALLQRLQLFAGLNEDQLAALCDCAERAIFPPGHTLLTAGSAVDHALLVVAGDVVQIDQTGAEHRFDEARCIPVGSLIAEMAMLTGDHVPNVTLRSISQARVLRFGYARVQALLETDQAMATHFVDVITARLNAMSERMRALETSLAKSA
ncbi:MAG: cyclic nucleotide-binding domain-containing protein [Pseudomonadota bacterium]